MVAASPGATRSSQRPSASAVMMDAFTAHDGRGAAEESPGAAQHGHRADSLRGSRCATGSRSAAVRAAGAAGGRLDARPARRGGPVRVAGAVCGRHDVVQRSRTGFSRSRWPTGASPGSGAGRGATPRPHCRARCSFAGSDRCAPRCSRRRGRGGAHGLGAGGVRARERGERAHSPSAAARRRSPRSSSGEVRAVGTAAAPPARGRACAGGRRVCRHCPLPSRSRRCPPSLRPARRGLGPRRPPRAPRRSRAAAGAGQRVAGAGVARGTLVLAFAPSLRPGARGAAGDQAWVADVVSPSILYPVLAAVGIWSVRVYCSFEARTRRWAVVVAIIGAFATPFFDSLTGGLACGRAARRPDLAAARGQREASWRT